MLKNIANQLADIGQVESLPKMDGRTMLMIIAPMSEKKKK
jgi:translation initiation factor IF-3